MTGYRWKCAHASGRRSIASPAKRGRASSGGCPSRRSSAASRGSRSCRSAAAGGRAGPRSRWRARPQRSPLVDVVDARLPQLPEVGEADWDPGRTGDRGGGVARIAAQPSRRISRTHVRARPRALAVSGDRYCTRNVIGMTTVAPPLGGLPNCALRTRPTTHAMTPAESPPPPEGVANRTSPFGRPAPSRAPILAWSGRPARARAGSRGGAPPASRPRRAARRGDRCR